MISEEFKTVSLNDTSIVDVTPGRNTLISDSSTYVIGDFNLSPIIKIGDVTIGDQYCFFVDSDCSEHIPIGMKQEGYEWVPVWSRKFF